LFRTSMKGGIAVSDELQASLKQEVAGGC
jgi:hypothetical protein